MQIRIKLQAKKADHAIKAIRDELESPGQLLGNIGESLLRVNRERHEQGLAPDGSKWKELSALTLKTKRKIKMLYENGDLLRFYYQVTGNNLTLTTNDWKAAFHHHGTRPYVVTPQKAKALKFAGMYRKRVNHPGLPARQLVGFPESDQQLASDVIRDHLNVILNRVR